MPSNDSPSSAAPAQVHFELDIAPGATVEVVATHDAGAAGPLVAPAQAPVPGPGPTAPGLAHVHLTVSVPPQATVRVSVTATAPGVQALPAPHQQSSPLAVFPTIQGWFARLQALPLATVLFVLGIGVYALTRLIGLEYFPIYFFADETSNVLYAEDLLARGLRDAQGQWLPLYFEAAALRWTPLLSVYVHLGSLIVFGKSLLVTRATSAVVTIVGSALVSLILRDVFKARYWWTGVLFMAIAPAWFLHSRTAFETAIMVAFFAGFLWCYLRYRTDDPRWLLPAVGLGAATFYTYSNGQTLMGATAVLLLLSDAGYHWQQRRWVAWALGLAALLAVPLIGFRLQHPEAFGNHLRAIDSFVFQDLPLLEKARRLLDTYLLGLSPFYWFFPHELDLPRHTMQGYGHLLLVTLPFTALGFGVCVWHWRSAPHRTLVLAALAVPVGAALVGVGITRVLAFVVPAALFAALGLETALAWLSHLPERWQGVGRFAQRFGPGLAFGLLAGGSLLMLRDALVNGPLWYRDYGLYGMQYGAKQIFVDTLPGLLREEPQTEFVLSSTWANGADAFVRFFLPREDWPRVPMRNVDYYLENPNDLSRVLLIMTPSEYAAAVNSGKFKRIEVVQVLPYPDGTPGFHFARLEYVDDVAAIFAAEIAARRQPVEEVFVLNGETLQISHSRLDMGEMHHIFDGDTFTLIRGMEANPFLLELRFPTARTLTGVGLDLGSMAQFEVVAEVYAGAEAPRVFRQTYRDLPPDPHVDLDFGGPQTVTRLRLLITNQQAGETTQIHVREVGLKP